jgi:hypothetical protein
MKNDTYFYDPIHGYCTCFLSLTRLKNESFNYLNQLRLKWDSYPRKGAFRMYCKCYSDIFHAGKDFLSVSDEESIAATKQYSSFKEGFQVVLNVKEIDLFNVGYRTHYVVCVLNLMNVKQVQPGIFEIGLSYELIQDYYAENMFYNIEKKLYSGNTLKFFSDISNITNILFSQDQDQIDFYERCVAWIKH